MDRLINWIIAHKLRTAVIVFVVAGGAGAMSAVLTNTTSSVSASPEPSPLPDQFQQWPLPTPSEDFASQSPSVMPSPKRSPSPSPYPSPSPEIPQVPSLLGMTESEYLVAAAAGGLTVKVVRWRVSAEVPGTVIAQHPKPGRSVEPGATVVLTLARADSPMGAGSSSSP